MAQDIQNNEQDIDIGKLIKSLVDQSPYLKGAYNASVKKGADDFNKASEQEGGEAANNQLLQRLMDMTKPKDIPGTKIGIPGAIGEFALGQGFNPNRPKQVQLGANTALALLKMIQDQAKAPREKAKDDLAIAKGMAELQALTPQGQQQSELYKAEGQALAQEKKEAAETKRNVGLAQKSLELTYKTWDDMTKKTEELSGLKAGRRAGVLTKYFALTGENPHVKAFRGQVAQSTARIAKIAAPSAKVGPELIKVFKATMPTEWDNLAESKNQIITSLTEGFGAYVTLHPEDFPEGADIYKFQEETSKMLDELVNKQNKRKGKKQQSSNSDYERYLKLTGGK